VCVSRIIKERMSTLTHTMRNCHSKYLRSYLLEYLCSVNYAIKKHFVELSSNRVAGKRASTANEAQMVTREAEKVHCR